MNAPGTRAEPAPGQPPPERERRSWPRQPSGREVAFAEVPGDGQTLWACIKNVSGGGVCLLLSTFFPPGTTLALRLPGGEHAAPRVIPFRVVHALRCRHGNSFLGCAFDGSLSEADLASLGAPPPPDPAPC